MIHIKKRRKRRIIILLFIIIPCMFAIIALFYYGFLRFNYPSFSRYPVQGMDISHHQGKIKWSLLDNKKFTFILIKATEGGDFVDHEFSANWKQARRNGFYTGAYHFFTFKKSGEEQAKNYIAAVPVEYNTLPPVIDLEFMGNGRSVPSRFSLLHELNAFIKMIEHAYRKKPVLYTTYEFYDCYLTGQYTGYPLWIRDIFTEPVLGNNRKWTFWQYTNRARILGIKGYVDLNVFNGNRKDFEDLIFKK